MTAAWRLPVVAVDATDPDALSIAADGEVTVVAVPVFASADGPLRCEGVPGAMTVPGVAATVTTELDSEQAARRGFAGKLGETLVSLAAGPEAPVLVFVGCGEAAQTNADSLRTAAAAFVRVAGRRGVALFLLPSSLAAAAAGRQSRLGPFPATTPVPADSDQSSIARDAASSLAQACILATYRYTPYKTEDAAAGGLDRVVVVGIGLDPGSVAEGVRRANVIARAVCLARDLVNTPPSAMTPTVLARVTGEEVASREGVTLEIWDEQRIDAEQLGGLAGVARGSAEPPRMVIARYEPDLGASQSGRARATSDGDGEEHVGHVVLVGKGITFDSGGLSLKTADGMVTMKTDMSGAAAVLAVVSACGDLGVSVRVTAIAPVTENMPGGRAIKPGDVLTIRDGKTIEVLNTDAEGRLVLADALSLAEEMAPDAVIDLATLTGACVVALGGTYAGLFSNDDALLERVGEASWRAGERTWPLPLPPEYSKHIDSEVADMKNVGKGGQAGAIAAALLLQRFVGEVPWVHMDMAGPARSDEDIGELTKGGTGFGVRTLLEFLCAYGTSPGS
jgi:leucyl aminopeptidase